jgi:hypothetical protein
LSVVTLGRQPLLPAGILSAVARLFPVLGLAGCQHNNIFRIAQQTSALRNSESDIAMATRLFLFWLLVSGMGETCFSNDLNISRLKTRVRQSFPT